MLYNNNMNKILLSLCLLLISLGSYSQGKLPKITLKDINGKTVQIDTLSNNGKPFMVAFLQLGVNLVIENSRLLTKFTMNGRKRLVYGSLLYP